MDVFSTELEIRLSFVKLSKFGGGGVKPPSVRHCTGLLLALHVISSISSLLQFRLHIPPSPQHFVPDALSFLLNPVIALYVHIAVSNKKQSPPKLLCDSKLSLEFQSHSAVVSTDMASILIVIFNTIYLSVTKLN
jgi:hypothetical protein